MLLGIDLVKFKDKKLTLPNISPEFIDISFDNIKEDEGKIDLKLPFSKNGIVLSSPIYDSKCLAEGQDVKKVYEFFLDSNEEKFIPGDTIGILTENQKENVDFLIERLELTNISDQQFCLKIKEKTLKKAAKIPFFIPTNNTIRNTLKNCLDLRSVPKKLFLLSLASYTEDENEKFLLDLLVSKEGSNEYNELFLSQQTNILDILKSLQTCKPPITIFFEHMPRLMPRPYSIASCPETYPNKIRIVFSMLENGLTCSMLENIIVKNDTTKKIEFYFRQTNQFHLPDDNQTNIIMIGPGTGISPFLGFLEHRSYLLKQMNKPILGDAWLFTGCRYRSRNYLYESEIKSFISDGSLTKHFESFSRDPNYKWKYVQDQIIENQNEFIKLFLNEKTKIFICGESKKMSPDIQLKIIECFKLYKGITDDNEALRYLIECKKNGKYIEDIWT